MMSDEDIMFFWEVVEVFLYDRMGRGPISKIDQVAKLVAINPELREYEGIDKIISKDDMICIHVRKKKKNNCK